jgi:hypothetical protein
MCGNINLACGAMIGMTVALGACAVGDEDDSWVAEGQTPTVVSGSVHKDGVTWRKHRPGAGGRGGQIAIGGSGGTAGTGGVSGSAGTGASGGSDAWVGSGGAGGAGGVAGTGGDDPATRMQSATAFAYARLAEMQQNCEAWTIPSPATSGAINAKSNAYSNLSGNGVTDDSAALQALINAVPAGSKIYFPAATYVFRAGGINVNKPLTLLGETGTVFGCGESPATVVFYLNRDGSPSSAINGIVITGITFEGGGDTDDTTILRAHNCNNLNIHHIKMLNVGHTGVALRDCDDGLIEQSRFDNVYQSGWGYGLWIMERTDRTTFRNNCCMTKGRHFVTTGPSVSGVQPQDYVAEILVENNYFEHSTNDAVNAHETQVGPYRIRGNVFYSVNQGVALWNGQGEVVDNVIIGAVQGAYLQRTSVNGHIPSWSESDQVRRNIMINIDMEGVIADRTYFNIQDNIIRGAGSSPGITIDIPIDGAARASCTIAGNVMENVSSAINLDGSPDGISLTDNYVKVGSVYQPAQ